MNPAINILTKTMVIQFYKQYAIFFFVALYLAFGILKISDHTYLNQSILSSNSFILVYFVLWTAYHILTLHFFVQSLQQLNLKFIYQLELYDFVPKLMALIVTQVQLLAPTMAYATFVLAIALGMKSWLFIWLMPVYFIFMLGLGSAYLLRIIQQPNIGSTAMPWQMSWLSKVRKSGFSFYFYELMLRQSVVFFFSKTIACLLLTACLYMFKTDDPSDLRPMLLGLLLAMIANSPLVKIYHQYENQTWKYFKNMPIGKFQTLTLAAATMAILCIPELILAFKFTPWNPWSIPLLMSSLYLPSMLTMFYCLLFHPLQSLPSFDNRLFAGGFIWFMAILFGIPVIVFILIALGTAVWLMNRYYYSYEYLIIEEP